MVNGENAAAGRGITAKLAEKLLASGADVVTLGNWAWGQPGFAPYLSGTDRVLRPANMSPQTPGTGFAVHGGVAVISLLGVFSFAPFESPFLAADRLVEQARRETPIVVVDFHAEATSEKVALARYLDGRVTAVLGTHTHVQTNDARVLAGGTAAITDAGMTGPHDSVIGSDDHNAIRRIPHRHAGATRAGDRGRAHRGRAARVRPRRARELVRGYPGLGRPGLSGHASTTSTASRATSRASTTPARCPPSAYDQ